MNNIAGCTKVWPNRSNEPVDMINYCHTTFANDTWNFKYSAELAFYFYFTFEEDAVLFALRWA